LSWDELVGSAYRTLQKMPNVSYGEVRVHVIENEFIWMRDGALEAFSSSESGGTAVRILTTGMGFASTADPSKVDEAVGLALKNSKASDKKVGLSQENFEKASYSSKVSKDPFSTSLQEKMEILHQIDSSAADEGISSRNIFLKLSREKTLVLNTDGAEISGEVTRVKLEVFLTHVSGSSSTQETESRGGSGGLELIDEWNLPEFVRSLSKNMKERLEKGVPAPRGKMDVVIGPYVSGLVAHESVGHPYEADRILGREAAQAGESFVTPDMLGSRIGTELVSVVDDPTIEGSYGFYLYDLEGVKARRRVLMKNGVINEFLHNRETASELSTVSNGSARASAYNREPIIRMANTFIAPGDMSPDEIIEDVSEGIYIKRFMEWNIDDRRYNQRYVGSEAYLIRGGKIDSMILKPVLEITTPGFYSSVDAVGKDLEFQAATCGKGDPVQGVPVWTGGPTLRLRGVGLGGI